MTDRQLHRRPYHENNSKKYKIRLSGFFREVYLLFREQIRITDLYVRSDLTTDFERVTVSAAMVNIGEADVNYSLYAPVDVKIEQGSVTVNGTETIKINVNFPMLWNDETPYLYHLELQCGKVCFRQGISLRRFEVEMSCGARLQ